MHWQPYTPDDQAPWNLKRVTHLHRRAGFSAPWNVLERDLREGPEAAINRLLCGQQSADKPGDDFEALSRTIGDAAVASDNPARLKAWWLYRMILSPDPLGERLTLLWHNHFATSNRKVQSLAHMREQNELFRRHARDNFADMLSAVVKHPAILIWLDADSNRRDHPNENLARELMELFTLGEGNYGESDVKEAARALTGWTVKGREFREVAAYQDDGEKAVLGRQGKLRGDDLLSLLLEQPATSQRLARRICELVMGEGVVESAAIDELAAGMRQHEQASATAGEDTSQVAGAKLAGEDSDLSTDAVGQRCPGDARQAVRDATGASPRTVLAAESAERRGFAPATTGKQGGIAWAVETVLRSAAFFADENIGNRVLGPAEYIVGAVRALELVDPPPSTIVLAEWTAALGQDLFEPPNVFGWSGGRSWINTRSLIARSNFAQRLAEGALHSHGAPTDWLAWARRHGVASSADDFGRLLARLLWAGAGDDAEVRVVRQAAIGDETVLTAESALRLVAAMLGSPRAQVG